MRNRPARGGLRGRFGPKETLALSAGVLLVVFLLLTLLFDPYREHAEDRLELETFDAASGEGLPAGDVWRRVEPRVEWAPTGGHGGSGGVRLTAEEGRGSWIERSIEKPRRYEALRVRARMRLLAYEPRARGYSGARWVLFFRDRDGAPMWRHPHVVCMEREAAGGGWIRCEGTFDVPPDAVSGHVRAQIVAQRGTLLVDDLEILPAIPRPIRFVWHGVLVVIWAATAVQVLLLVRPWRHPLGAAQLALASLIVVGTVAPAWMLQDSVELVRDAGRDLEQRWDPEPPPAKRETASSAPGQAERRRPDAPAAETPAAKTPGREADPTRPETTGPTRPEPAQPSGDPGLTRWLGRLAGSFDRLLSGTKMVATAKQSGHALLFFLLAVAAYAGQWRRGAAAHGRGWVQASLLLIGFAAATEMLQAVTPSRAPALEDWALDLAGIAGGLALCGLLFALFGRRTVRTSSASQAP
jgi:hypothetical protein